jgi:signal peptidase I
MSFRDRLSSRAVRLLAALSPPVFALAATVATLHFLIPTRFDAGATGFFAWLARLQERDPLPLAVVLFVLFSAVESYWWRQVGAVAEAGPGGDLSLRRMAISLAVLAAIVFVARTRLVEISRVVGPSMVPTLNVGDRLVVNRAAYGVRLFSGRALWPSAPRRGDLIVFPDPEPDGTEPASVVKRVIGLPGDEIAFVDGSPVVNGWVVPSCDAGPFLAAAGTSLLRGRLAVEVLGDRAYLTLRASLDAGRFARFKVPPGELFVLGDDRPISRDSRAWNGGRGGGIAIVAVEGRVSRLAAALGSDGRLELGHPFAGLRPKLRATHADVGRLERRISDCLAHPPQSSWPRDR